MLGKVQEGEGAAQDERVGGTTGPMDTSLSKRWEIAKDGAAWCAAVHEGAKSQTRLGDNDAFSHPFSTQFSGF